MVSAKRIATGATGITFNPQSVSQTPDGAGTNYLQNRYKANASQAINNGNVPYLEGASQKSGTTGTIRHSTVNHDGPESSIG